MGLEKILPKIQKLPPEDVIAAVRRILDLESETFTAHTPFSREAKTVTTAVTPAEKLIRIGVMLMCIEPRIGSVISDEIANRIFVIAASERDPAKMCLGES